MFKAAVAVLLTTVVVLLIVIGKQFPEALADRQPFDRNQLAEQLKNTVTRVGDRYSFACSRIYSPKFYSKCEDLRAEHKDLIGWIEKTKRDGSDEDLRSVSRTIAAWEIWAACNRYPVGDPNRPSQEVCNWQ